jgi:hypothetical protein
VRKSASCVFYFTTIYLQKIWLPTILNAWLHFRHINKKGVYKRDEHFLAAQNYLCCFFSLTCSKGTSSTGSWTPRSPWATISYKHFKKLRWEQFIECNFYDTRDLRNLNVGGRTNNIGNVQGLTPSKAAIIDCMFGIESALWVFGMKCISTLAPGY